MRREAGHVVKIHEPLARYFYSPHFDWDFDSPPLAPGEKRYSINLGDLQMTPSKWAWNKTGGTRVVTTMASHASRVLKTSASLRNSWRERFFPRQEKKQSMLASDDGSLRGCLMRYLLAPTRALEHAVHKATGAQVNPGGLMPLASAHVRIGDSNFAHAPEPGSKRTWQFEKEVLRGGLQLFTASPAAPLECLQRLSEDASGECLGCVVLTDSSWVEECGQTLFGRPVATPGIAVHLGASSNASLSDPLNVQRVFVDWFLLAHSAATLRLSPGSTFSMTASQFRQASAKLPANECDPKGGANIGGTWPHLCVPEAFVPFNPVTRDEAAKVDDWWRAQCVRPER